MKHGYIVVILVLLAFTKFGELEHFPWQKRKSWIWIIFVHNGEIGLSKLLKNAKKRVGFLDAMAIGFFEKTSVIRYLVWWDFASFRNATRNPTRFSSEFIQGLQAKILACGFAQRLEHLCHNIESKTSACTCANVPRTCMTNIRDLAKQTLAHSRNQDTFKMLAFRVASIILLVEWVVSCGRVFSKMSPSEQDLLGINPLLRLFGKCLRMSPFKDVSFQERIPLRMSPFKDESLKG